VSEILPVNVSGWGSALTDHMTRLLNTASAGRDRAQIGPESNGNTFGKGLRGVMGRGIRRRHMR
jgi:hypothetical protein